MARALRALIDPKALIHNFNVVKKLAPNSKVMAMIKADAYGHGMLYIANLLRHADAFGVACIEEAILLRRGGVTKQRIILMEGLFSVSELTTIMEHDLEVVVHNSHQLALLLQNTTDRKINVWFKINTGMNRLGFNFEEAAPYYQTLIAEKNIKISGIMTHFSAADELDNKVTKTQFKRFNDFCNKYVAANVAKCVANSAAIFKSPETHLDWVRPGLMLYGISPLPDVTSYDLGLIPVMTLETEIIAMHRLKKGETIGYSPSFVVSRDMHIGTIAIGYADGFSSTFSNAVSVLVNNKRSNLIGKVFMDMATIDLTHIPDAKVGDKVILWGKDLLIEEISKATNIITYELITNLGIRVAKEISES